MSIPENGAPTGPGGLRRLALHDRHTLAGARLAPFAGWEMPLQYEGILAEHAAVREHAGVFDVSHLGRVELRGPDAATQLRSVTTFDVTALQPGEAHYSLYCNEDGGILDDVFVYCLEAERWLVVHNAANEEADVARLQAVSGGEATDRTGASVMLAVQGPAARELLAGVLGDQVLALPARGCASLRWREKELLFARTGYTGEDGGECVAPVETAAALWDALVEAGAQPAGLGARDTLRLEAALPLHGNDIDRTTTPYEAGLGFAVTLEDGAPFTGRDALEAASAAPPTRKLAHLRSDERAVFRQGYPVREAAVDAGGDRDAAPLARLTSGAFSPSLRVAIGMAYLPTTLASPGTRLTVDVRGRPVPAEVVRRPFYRRPKTSRA